MSELVLDRRLTPKRRFQLEGAINELDFVCMVLQQNALEQAKVFHVWQEAKEDSKAE